MWRGPGWGVSNSGSRGRPLGEGGSEQQRGARCEACVRKGAPTGLPARQPAQGWAAGCRRSQAGCGEGAGVGRGWEVRLPPGAASSQRTAGGAWNLADLGRTTLALALPPELPGKLLMGTLAALGVTAWEAESRRHLWEPQAFRPHLEI